MHVAARSYLTAGVALVGAGVIAVTPVAPTPPDIQTRAVQLAAAVDDPAEVFAPVFEAASAMIETALAYQLSNPAPALQQFVKNQVENATILGDFANLGAMTVGQIASDAPGVALAAIEKSLAGDPAGAFGDLVGGVMLPAVGLIVKAGAVWSVFQRSVLVASELVRWAPGRVVSMVASLMVPGVPAIQQLIRSTQSVATAVTSLDPVKVINAVQHGIADVSLANIAVGAVFATQINNSTKTLVRALQARPAGLPAPAPAGATATLVAAPEAPALAAPKAEVTAPTPAAVEVKTVETTDDNEGAATKSTKSVKVVRDSAIAKPGEVSTPRSRSGNATKLVKPVSDKIASTVSKVRSGLKAGFGKAGKKAAGAGADRGADNNGS